MEQIEKGRADPTGATGVLWDLSPIYSGPEDPAIETDLRGVVDRAGAFRARFRGRVGRLGAAELAEAVAELESLYAELRRPLTFAYLRYAADTGDPDRAGLFQRVRERASAVEGELLFFGLEWGAVPRAEADRLLADPALGPRRGILESIRRRASHGLSEAEERLVAQKELSGSGAWFRLFTELVAGLRIEVDGEERSLEDGLALLEGEDPDLRRRTADAITRGLEEGVSTRGFVFDTLLLDKAVDDRIRGHPHWMSAHNLANGISDEVVGRLLDAVVDRYDIPQRYYRLKARLMGLDRLSYESDRLAVVGASWEPVGWAEARSIVVDGYTAFSAEVGRIVRDVFDEDRIHAAPGPRKMPHAVTINVPPARPHVLITYTGGLRSLLMLAHELGHAVHGALAAEGGVLNTEIPDALAESGSLFGELLTFRRLIEGEADPGRRLELLMVLLDSAVNMVFRHVAMTRFADRAHGARRSGGQLGADAISDLWLEAHEEMLGDSVDLREGFRWWWSYVPHFVHDPGHEYTHAFGYLFSHTLYERYAREGDAMVEPFLRLLRAGGSVTPARAARLVGLDLEDAAFWATGLEGIDRLMAEAEGLERGL